MMNKHKLFRVFCQMALNQEKCEVLTDSIADKLLMSEKLAQAKNLSHGF